MSIGTELASSQLTVAGTVEAASLVVGADKRFAAGVTPIADPLEKLVLYCAVPYSPV